LRRALDLDQKQLGLRKRTARRAGIVAAKEKKGEGDE